MVKHIQTIRWQFADELFECVWPFCGISTQRVKHFFMRILLGQKHLSLRSPGIVITISRCKYVKQWTSIIASVRMGHQNCNSTAGQQLIDSGEKFLQKFSWVRGQGHFDARWDHLFDKNGQETAFIHSHRIKTGMKMEGFQKAKGLEECSKDTLLAQATGDCWGTRISVIKNARQHAQEMRSFYYLIIKKYPTLWCE